MPMLSGAVLAIDLNAVAANYRRMRSLVNEGTEIAAVVKSDAYGLGLKTISRTLSNAGCKVFFVADLNEALALRSVCHDASVVVLRADMETASDILRGERLIPVVNCEEDLHAAVGAHDPLPYFLNIDTGFSRFGLRVERLRDLAGAGRFHRRPPLCLFSHLSCSDEPRNPMNEEQKARFTAAAATLPRPRKSLSASAGIWLDRSFHFDMARIGSALFGLNNARISPNPLRPVVRLRAPLVDVREVASSQPVGYGATFRTQRTTSLGIVGIGYKHGLPWACANKITARVADFCAPVVGRIGMEFTAVDLTEVPEFERQRGAIVEFLYDGFGVDELAVAAGVNGQEVLVRLGAGCRRAYASEASKPMTITAMVDRRSSFRTPATKVA